MLDTLTHADPARHLEPPPPEHTRARLDALLAAEIASGGAETAPGRGIAARRRRPAARSRRPAVAIAAVAVLAAALAVSLRPGANPAQAFASRLQGDGIVHMVFAHQRTHDASGDGVNPRQDEVWISLADGSWRLRIRLFGNTIDSSFDGRTVTTHESATGKTTSYTPADPALLKGRPLGGPSVEPLSDPDFKNAGETTIDGETVYDLMPVRAQPGGVELHWYVTKDGKLRRIVQQADDLIVEGGKRGPASLTTDVETYEVLADTPASEALLR
jgi:hypothetical protein